ncbi:MAG: hypothetical protein CL569_15390 [Alphaproteobacteria bacterium]|nr:hypothetical protein [Alphaproteobacteria bacterium]|tara:strand:- start:5850 stop:6236 length:387 start_codon:yes stop_codon:yes gene_type:complete
MMRPLYIAAFVVAVMLTYGLYSMKYEVQRLESKLLSLQTELGSEREAVQVLRAEWSYLNSPERLQKLAARHLELTPVSLHRLAALDRLPLKEILPDFGKRGPEPNPSASKTSWNKASRRNAAIADGDR